MVKKPKKQPATETKASNPAPAVESQKEQPNLSIQDLILVAQIIQICSARGAFKADEMASVGSLYEKLIAFLRSTGALTPAPTEEK